MTGRLTPFLVALARDPELYAAWIRQPEAVMVWAGLDSEDRAALHSQDQNRIYQALFRPASAPVAPGWTVPSGATSAVPTAATAVYCGSYAYPPVTMTVPSATPQPGCSSTSCS
jgi:hypothetical protein